MRHARKTTRACSRAEHNVDLFGARIPSAGTLPFSRLDTRVVLRSGWDVAGMVHLKSRILLGTYTQNWSDRLARYQREGFAALPVAVKKGIVDWDGNCRPAVSFHSASFDNRLIHGWPRPIFGVFYGSPPHSRVVIGPVNMWIWYACAATVSLMRISRRVCLSTHNLDASLYRNDTVCLGLPTILPTSNNVDYSMKNKTLYTMLR
jgi:hypothetical protein